jgi:hypothetical protein
MANGSGAERQLPDMRRLFSRENIAALLLCLIILLLIVMMSENTPQWIYQGF